MQQNQVGALNNEINDELTVWDVVCGGAGKEDV